MGRKKITDLESYKFTLNLSGKNKIALDILTQKLGMQYGPTINMILSTFLDMPMDVRYDIVNYCEAREKKLEKIKAVAGKLEQRQIQREKECCKNILNIINYKKICTTEEVTPKKRIALKNGYVIIPEDWILLNPEDAKNSREVDVVECRHSEEYGIPHFVYFTNDYINGDETAIEEMCVKAYPKFREIMDMQVEPIRNPDRNGKYLLNAEEWMAAPTIGHFPLPEKGENPNPPFGAMIVRE